MQDHSPADILHGTDRAHALHSTRTLHRTDPARTVADAPVVGSSTPEDAQ